MDKIAEAKATIAQMEHDRYLGAFPDRCVIAEAKATIAQMEQQIAAADPDDFWGHMNIVEYKQEIADCKRRIAYLDGSKQKAVISEAQIELMDWVLSDAYDDE